MGNLDDTGGRAVKYAIGAAVVLLAGWLVLPTLVLNLGTLYLRDLAMDRAAGDVPWVVRELPLVKDSAGGAWLAVRASRLLESKGQPPTPLPPGAHALVARAFSEGRVHPHTQMEAELLAWSCIAAAMADRCLPQMQRQDPEMGEALSSTGVVSAAYVDELNEASGARLGAALAARASDCAGGLAFLRRWIDRDGFRSVQLAAARSLAATCPALAEAQFYSARAADLSGLADEAAASFEHARPAEHPEVAYWLADFRIRHGEAPHMPATAVPTRRLFDAQMLAARFEDGTPMGPETLVGDAAAPGAIARRAARFGAVLAYGPYVRLAPGRYRVSVFVRASGSGRALRFDVKEDSDTWRPYLWNRIVEGAEPGTSGYQQIAHEFTSTGEGIFSVAVVTLTRSPVAFARMELERRP